MAAASRFDVGAALAYALLWGIAVTVLESTDAAFHGALDTAPWTYLAVLLLMWTSRALVLTLSAHAAAGRLGASTLAALFAVEAVALSLAWDGTPAIAVAAQGVLGLPVQLSANFIFNLWVMVAYGGPLFWLCLLGQRLRRSRDVLARAEIERNRSAALIDEARLKALQARVDPALLLGALGALRERYRQGRESAELLLDALVGFLRGAMPGVRGSTSTLRDEIAHLRAHDELAAQLDAGHLRCVIEGAAVSRGLPFPPLLLLPLLQRLRAAQPLGAPPPRVALTAHEGSLTLTLDGHPSHDDWIGAELTQRLAAALHAWGEPPGRWAAGGSPSLTLFLPLPSQPTIEEPAHDPQAQPIA
jgi:hypothetical protein